SPQAGAPDAPNPDEPDARQADAPVDTLFENAAATQDDPPAANPDTADADAASTAALDEIALREEIDQCWHLNLSMNFRDGSPREKFFVTYLPPGTRLWRRVTISIDYRKCLPDSLEADVYSLHYKKDKVARVYAVIRASLPAIGWYDEVTNLKIETVKGRLNVHVTRDVNEIIAYPPLALFANLTTASGFLTVPEPDLHFMSHLSGFVYKVSVPDHGIYVKKDIPGPDSTDEFVYEANALHDLRACPNIATIAGLVLDAEAAVVKGLLIGYAPRGALVDILDDARRSALPWSRRVRWARDIVRGVAALHGGGFVQGDLTLSNVVVDAQDRALIIDVNRRGCPLGWEPPELVDKIRAGVRVGLFIGVRTDLWQLGMCLWAIGVGCAEPERVEQPFEEEVPEWYKEIVGKCLSREPRERVEAAELFRMFPPDIPDEGTDAKITPPQWVPASLPPPPVTYQPQDDDEGSIELESRAYDPDADEDPLLSIGGGTLDGPAHSNVRSVTGGMGDVLFSGLGGFAAHGIEHVDSGFYERSLSVGNENEHEGI
ncbi:kinase-like protein, partial [Trichodelitschia bisporula]